jgi:hypothetical protein
MSPIISGRICTKKATRLLGGLDMGTMVRWRRPICNKCFGMLPMEAKIYTIIYEGEDFIAFEVMES